MGRHRRTRIIESWPARSNVAHNPFQYQMSGALTDRGWLVREFSPWRSAFRSADLWLWHWPDGHFAHSGAVGARVRAALLRSLLLAARCRRIPVIWTVHNVGNHEGRNLGVERRFLKRFHQQIAGVHYLGEYSARTVKRSQVSLRYKPSCTTPHGHYRPVVSAWSRERSRLALGLPTESVVMVFAGKIRQYKGVAELLRAFLQTADPRMRLVVAGAVGDGSQQYLEEAAGRDDRIMLILRHLDDPEMACVFGAADFAVMPFESITNSGSAMLALSLDRPIVVPALPQMCELRDAVGARWVDCYQPPLSALILDRAARRYRSQDADVPDLTAFGWESISETLDGWYEEVINGR